MVKVKYKIKCIGNSIEMVSYIITFNLIGIFILTLTMLNLRRVYG